LNRAYAERTRSDVTTFAQMQVKWTGISGMPGYTNFYFQAIDDFAPTDVKGFFNILGPALPAGVTINIPNNGKTIDLATGQANGTWSHGTAQTVTGTNTTQTLQASGLVFNWHTGYYVGGRELRGKTFIVPICANIFNPNGTLVTSWKTNVANAAAALVAATAQPIVWSRARNTTASITSGAVPDKQVVLRSRRD
jgi:hypothetical protein